MSPPLQVVTTGQQTLKPLSVMTVVTLIKRLLIVVLNVVALILTMEHELLVTLSGSALSVKNARKKHNIGFITVDR